MIVYTSEYKGYIGQYEYISDDKAYHGFVYGIDSIIHFTADEEENVDKEFRESVDDYLEWCQERGKEPEKPASIPQAAAQ